eukprot:COSAG01_NODE_4226_length_5224_cov_15.169171_3_plen_798_part_00
MPVVSARRPSPRGPSARVHQIERSLTASVDSFEDIISSLRAENQQLRRSLTAERLSRVTQPPAGQGVLLGLLLLTALTLAFAVSHHTMVPDNRSAPPVADASAAAALDLCSVEPCLHGGTCTRGMRGQAVRCLCSRFWSGLHCERPSGDPCVSEPCQYGGWCSTTTAARGTAELGYVCACRAGYRGPNCASSLWGVQDGIDIEPPGGACLVSPCRNGAECLEDVSAANGFRCQCKGAWIGILCSEQRPDQPAPSNLDGTGHGSGQHMVSSVLLPQDMASETDALDESHMHSPTITTAPESVVPAVSNLAGAAPPASQRQIPAVQPSPPPLPAPPTASINAAMISTGSAASGGKATVVACDSQPCLHDGQCYAAPPRENGWRVMKGSGCTNGFESVAAEVIESEKGANMAAQVLCEWCIVAVGQHHRLSGRGYGSKLEEESNPGSINDHLCQPVAPKPGAAAPYACSCKSGWAGDECETDVDECSSTPCMHGGTCEESAGDSTIEVGVYHCTCVLGWRGDRCQLLFEHCESKPCQNNGVCYSNSLAEATNGYRCKCSAGWTGDNCATDIDECASMPCKNEGTCLSSSSHYVRLRAPIGEFVCLCAVGFGGSTCRTTVGSFAAETVVQRELAPRLSQSCQSQQGMSGYFDGSGGFVILPPMGLHQTIAIALWMRLFSDSEHRQIILASHGDVVGVGGICLFTQDGALSFGITGVDGKEAVHRFVWTPPSNEWAHVAVSYGSGARFVDLHVDMHFVESARLRGPEADLNAMVLGGPPLTDKPVQTSSMRGESSESAVMQG